MTDIAFPAGLPGFEACRRFVLLAPEAGGPLRCLRSTTGPAASFLVIDPRSVEPAYDMPLAPVDRQRLAAGAGTSLVWLAVVTPEADGTIAANLRAPIVINPDAMIGAQLIPQQSPYAVRHVLVEGA